MIYHRVPHGIKLGVHANRHKRATTVLTETDMVAGLTATSQRKYEPGVLVSRDHPFISGFMGASMAGGPCCTGTAGSAKKTSESGHLVASFLQPKRLSDCFRARRTSAIGSPKTHVGEGSSSTCLLSTPHRVTSKSTRSARASVSLAYRR